MSKHKGVEITKENYLNYEYKDLNSNQKAKHTNFRKEAEREAKIAQGIYTCESCSKDFNKSESKSRFVCSFKCLFYKNYSYGSSEYILLEANGSYQRNECFKPTYPDQKWLFWVDKNGNEISFTGIEAAYIIKFDDFKKKPNESLECPKNKKCINPKHLYEKRTTSLYEQETQGKLHKNDIEKFESMLKSEIFKRLGHLAIIEHIEDGLVGDQIIEQDKLLDLLNIINGIPQDEFKEKALEGLRNFRRINF